MKLRKGSNNETHNRSTISKVSQVVSRILGQLSNVGSVGVQV